MLVQTLWRFLQFFCSLILLQNPFYAHPNESAMMELVTSPLDGKYYHAWSQSMVKAIIMKIKLRFLDRFCPMLGLVNLGFFLFI
jgi:hypothetical protein